MHAEDVTECLPIKDGNDSFFSEGTKNREKTGCNLTTTLSLVEILEEIRN